MGHVDRHGGSQGNDGCLDLTSLLQERQQQQPRLGILGRVWRTESRRKGESSIDYNNFGGNDADFKIDGNDIDFDNNNHAGVEDAEENLATAAEENAPKDNEEATMQEFNDKVDDNKKGVWQNRRSTGGRSSGGLQALGAHRRLDGRLSARDRDRGDVFFN